MSLSFRAGYEKNVSICNAIKNENTEIGCLAKIAQESGNPEICKDLQDSDSGIICRAAATNNTDMCDQIKNKDKKDLCKTAIGLVW